MKTLVILAAIGAFALLPSACKSDQETEEGANTTEHPAGDHPAGDHPAGDHPAGDHPEGDHPG